jgi:hypothetical protein
MRRLTSLAIATLFLGLGVPVHAQRWTNVEGSETCRDIWEEFGRTMRGRPVAVYCEVRDVGTRPATGRIDIDGEERQGVLVRGSGRRDVGVRLVIQAQGRSVEDARAIAKGVTVDLADKSLRVVGIDDDFSDRHFVAATILVDVPKESDLSLRVGSAPLTVENVVGRMELRAAHGPLSVRNVGGDVRARVEYGPLTVDLDAPRWQGTRLDAEAEYGPVTLRVPKDFGADLEIGTEHGPFDVDFPITLTRLDGSSIRTKLGAGGPPVRAVARYGPMSLKMKGS